ncbi:MAG TPA: hypothetical protein VFH27_02860, partial [Longimicrobiaceae bacterium]|nr:hypothetical protein [Longimicrobiaceae bacterium]
MHGPAVVRSFSRLAGAALLAVLAMACEHRPTDPGVVASIVVTRNPDTLAIGTSRQFTAVGRDADGTVVGINPTWKVAAGGGTINGTGVFTAGTVPGTFANTVVASVGSISGSATATVTPGAAASITVTPSLATLTPTGTQQFTAVVRDASGNVLSTTPAWAVVAGGGAITSAGLFTAGTVSGTFPNTVTATLGSLVGTASVAVIAAPPAVVTVTPNPATVQVGGTQQFTATALDAFGNPVPFTANWSVVAGGGTISAAGVFTAGTMAGTFANTVRACSTAACGAGSMAGTATVVVTGGALASISVTPNPTTVGTGASRQFTATGRDANGNVVPIPNLAWSVVAGGGTIDAAGLFTAGGTAGTFGNTVRASSGGIFGEATVTVTPGPLSSITVTPDPTTVAAGATRQFTAVGHDANGNVVATPGLAWTVVAGGGTINGSGLFTAGGTAGTYNNTVRATSGSVFGDATVTVTAGGLATITVTPDPTTVAAGATRQFTATGRDANGNVVATPGLVWSVVAGGGTINSGSGLFTAGAVGGTYNNTVRATSGAIFGDATVIVDAPIAGGISLGSAATHGILAGTAVSCASAPGIINADVSVWPGIAITGFPPCTITGQRHAGDTYAQNAQQDLTSAYLALQALPCDVTITSNLGGTTLSPGVYCSTTSVGVTGVVTLNGPSNAVFVI